MHEDPNGCDHELFSQGLRASLFNYMHGICFDFSLAEWFDFKTPLTSISEDYIEKSLEEISEKEPRPNAVVVWLGNLPTISFFKPEDEDDDSDEIAELLFFNKKEEWILQINSEVGQWIFDIIPKLIIGEKKPLTFKELREDFLNAEIGDFEDFTQSEIWEQLQLNGLLVL